VFVRPHDGPRHQGAQVKPFDENGAFRPAAGGDGLRRLAVRGAGVTVLSHSLQFAIQMIATVVLARLLTPADFGLVTMVSTFSLLFLNLGLNGFTEAILQREEINHALVSNLFWINTGMGLLLTIGFAGAAPLLARFYGDPRVASVTVAIALTILFTSVSVQHQALLMRAMRFSDVAANGVVARGVSVTLSIFLALMGWGYWALVAGAVASPLATSAGAWTLCRWVPGPPRRAVGTSSMVRFAMNTYGRFITSYFTRNMDNLLIGWRFGPESLGFYKKAYDLFIGRADRSLSWGVVKCTVTGSLFLLGLRWGPVGVAVACVTSFSVLTIPALWYAGRPAPLDIASIIAAVWKYVLASALAGGASAMIIWEIPSFAVPSGSAG